VDASHPNCRAVQQALRNAGAAGDVRILDEPAPTAAKAAEQLGTEQLNRATPELVRSATGQPIGGVAPLAHPQALRTLIDNDLAAFETIWAAGGVPHAVFPTTFAELVRVTGGTPADIA
jgi:prolyl-tRNA editing enzyme YbaK/EbsC (Cys-tRNA(Pro) deacylase)